MIYMSVIKNMYNSQYVTEANKKKKDEEDDKDEYTIGGEDETQEDGNDEYTVDEDEETGDDNEDEYTIDGIDSEGDDDMTDEEDSDNEDDEDTTESDVEEENDENEYTMDGDDTDNSDDVDSEDASDDDIDDNETEDVLMTKEKELFANLSPDEMAIKEKELKDCFLQLYNVIDDIISKIQRIPTQNETQNIIEFINKKLNETSVEVKNYMCNAFDNKTYFQNVSQYNFYILILKNIEKVFNEINVKTE